MPEFPIPIKGVSYGFSQDKSPPLTSHYMNNCRPIDVLEKKVRLGQRPGLDKVYTQQIGGMATSIICMLSVTVVT